MVLLVLEQQPKSHKKRPPAARVRNLLPNHLSCDVKDVDGVGSVPKSGRSVQVGWHDDTKGTHYIFKEVVIATEHC